MCRKFYRTVHNALSSDITKYLVLGDSEHGGKSLKSLAAAIKNGHLNNLETYGVTTVLIEGPTQGSNVATYNHGCYAAAAEILAQGKVTVVGSEDKDSLSTFSQLEALVSKPPEDFEQQHQALLNKRMPDANIAWTTQMGTATPKAILCCGTSHVPMFYDKIYFDLGVVNRLNQAGFLTYGFAVENPNTDNDRYIPEPSTKLFGAVDAIGAYDGWEKIK